MQKKTGRQAGQSKPAMPRPSSHATDSGGRVERSPFFVGGAPALDFLNSVASPLGVPVDWLGSGEDFLKWLAQPNLVSPEVLERVRASAGPGELDAVAAQARALRDWFRQFVISHMGRRLTPAAVRELDPLNRLLARDEVYGQVIPRQQRSDSDASPLAFVADRRWRTPDTLLMPLAKAMADLLTMVDFRHVKACEWHACTLLFVDTTKGRMRRWCSMAVCGNRAKQAAHRARSISGSEKN